MIKRIWHGYTTRENASAYLALLQGEVIPGIEARKINGYRGIDVLRKDNGDEIEFVTIMTFDSIDNVKEFQGEDYEACHVPDAAPSGFIPLG